MRFRGNPYVYAAGFATGLLLYWWAAASGDRTDDWTDGRDAMIGTWTDPAGPPGNSIRFYYVPRDLPEVPVVKAYEGHISLVKFLGEENTPADWNYGSWDPLVLNVIIGKKGYYAAIRKIDDDHIQIRFGTDAEEMYKPEAIDHPDTRTLTRIGREPAP
jgi:hypothetical protein